VVNTTLSPYFYIHMPGGRYSKLKAPEKIAPYRTFALRSSYHRETAQPGWVPARQTTRSREGWSPSRKHIGMILRRLGRQPDNFSGATQV